MGDTGRTDAALIARVLDGRVNAYAPLVERYQAPLYRHARGMGLDPDSAEDMVQDTFVRAYAALRECRDPAHFRAWLYRILRNCCLDHMKNLRQQWVPLDDVASTEPVMHAAGSAELRREVDDALARLSPLLREAFLLKHEGGYTYDEIAGITDSSPSAVKMRVQRARDELRATLDVEPVRAM